MKKAILFFSIFLISLIIGCSDELPVNVSTNTGEEDLTGLGDQYEWLQRIKIKDLDGNVLANSYKKHKDYSGTAFEGVYASFILTNQTEVIVEETIIWSIKNHGNTMNFEAVYQLSSSSDSSYNYLKSVGFDTLDVPDIQYDSRGYRIKITATPIVLNSGSYFTYFELGTHPGLSMPPFLLGLSVSLYDGDDFIQPLFLGNQYIAQFGGVKPKYSPSMYFGSKINLNPRSLNVQIDSAIYYGNKWFYIDNNTYFDNYKAIFQIREIGAAEYTTVEANFGDITFDTLGVDYQGLKFETDSLALYPEKEYEVRFGAQYISK